MRRKTDSNNPADWLYIAAEDLEDLHARAEQELGYAMGRSKLAGVLEKVLKAELIRTGWILEKTHDLAKLHEVLNQHSPELAPNAVTLCDELAEAYFTDRYPGFDLEEPDWPKLRALVKAIEELLAAVKARLPAGN